MDFVAPTALALLLAANGAAQGPHEQARLWRNTVIENQRVCSPNGRACLFRQFESIRDFTGHRAQYVFDFPFRKKSIAAGDSWTLTQPDRGFFTVGPAFPAERAALYLATGRRLGELRDILPRP